MIEGAYPAQYGLKFGSVLNLSTRSGTGPAGFDGNASGGSDSDLQQTLGYHLPLAGGGGASFAIGNSHTTRGLDPPNFGSPHDDASIAISSPVSQFPLVGTTYEYHVDSQLRYLPDPKRRRWWRTR